MTGTQKKSLGGLSDLLANVNKPSTTTEVITGKPLHIKLSEIEEDPDQPRTEFDEEFIAELAQDLRNGTKIKSPISVRPKGDNGKYRINHGANRYRASVAAGTDTIPAFIDDDHNPYDQVMENLKRRDLSPYDLARWMQARIDNQGESHAKIAAGLGIQKNAVTMHLGILKCPDYVRALYDEKITTSERVLYDLQVASGTDETKTREFCAHCLEKGSVSVREVMAFKKSLVASGKPVQEQAQEQNSLAQDQGGESTSSANAQAGAGSESTVATNPGSEDGPQQQAPSPAAKAKKPVVLVKMGKLDGQLVTTKPAGDGQVWVLLENGEEVETEAQKVKLLGVVAG